jgi:hypothetical protein
MTRLVNASEFRVDNRITPRLSDDSLAPFPQVIRRNRPRAITRTRENRRVSRGVGSTQLLCSVRKLTAVGYLIKPVSCSNAKHRLFSYFPAIFGGSTTLQRLDSRSRLSPNQPLSGGQSETNTLRLSGLCCVTFKLTLATGLTTRGYELSA